MGVPINRYRVILIEEGLGNLGTCFYYTRDALEYAAENKVFEGKKCYANHPDAIEEKTLPERSVRDIIGYFENTHVESGNSGQALLVGDLCLPDDPALTWVRTLVECSLDTAGKFNEDFVGLSINASGDGVEKDIESFMNGSTIPDSALPKLLQAKAQGITEVDVTTKLMEAVSCDLVTEAGAGGRIVKKILESKRGNMKNKKLPTKDTKKKTREADGAQDQGHDDAAQDVELIKSMLKQYCGSEDPSDDEVESMKQALSHAHEMGLSGKEAEACAGHSLKMAKHVAAKQAEAKEGEESEAHEGEESEAHEAEDAETDGDDGDAGDDTDSDADDSGDAPAKKKAPIPAKQGKKESKISQAARIAKLEAELAQEKREKLIEKSVRESGLPKTAQKKLRESIEGMKSDKGITEAVKLFKEAFGLGGHGDMIINPEKDGAVSGEGEFTLADCVKSEN